MKIKFLYLPLLVFLSIEYSFGQNNSLSLLSSSGDTYKNNLYQLDWSIGELQTEILKGNSFTITQGFQQGNLVPITSNLDRTIFLNTINVFPNPSNSYLILNTDLNKLENAYYRLIDLNGGILISCPITKNSEFINIEQFKEGTYILNVCSNKSLIQSFKLLKLNSK